MRRYCLACDLKDDPELIAKYKQYHAPGNAWPEITQGIKDTGVLNMEIYLTGNRLFMIMEVNQDFDFTVKARMDADNPRVQEWEELMGQFQQILPWAGKEEKWVLMENIFQLQH